MVLTVPPLAVGWLLLLTLLAFLGASYGPLSSLPAAVLAWVAGVLVLPRVDQGTRRVAGVLLPGKLRRASMVSGLWPRHPDRPGPGLHH